jgi:hypothetical protein
MSASGVNETVPEASMIITPSGDRAVTADKIKHSKPAVIASDRFAIDDAGSNRQRLDRLPR